MDRVSSDIISRLQKYSLTAKFYNDVVSEERPKQSFLFQKVLSRTEKNESKNDNEKMTSNRSSDEYPVTGQNKRPFKTENNSDLVCEVENTNPCVGTDVYVETKRSGERKVKDRYRVAMRDQLFWCLIMAVKSWEEGDLPEKRERFLIETTEKTSLTEMLQKTEDVPWKELKLSRTAVCSALGASINHRINVDVLRALAFLYGKNIAYLWGKGRCVKIPGARASCGSEQSQKWHVIYRDRSGYSLATDEHAVDVMKRIDLGNEFFIVEDPNKPLMSVSSYKIGELQEIANKLGVDISRSCGEKAKLKKDLYQDIVDSIHKID